MKRFSVLWAFALVLLVAATSQSMAVARVAMAASGHEITLCTGQGLITVRIDEYSDPAKPAHFCPDCLLTIATVLEAQGYAAAQQDCFVESFQAYEKTCFSQALKISGGARAPPLSCDLSFQIFNI